MKVLGGRVGVRDVLIGGIQIDHDTVEIMFVERRALMRAIHRVEDADARIVHGNGALCDEPGRQQGEQNHASGGQRHSGKYIGIGKI